MAYAIITESGSSYIIENGRITRVGDNDIVDRSTGKVFHTALVAEPFQWIVPPVVGAQAKFRLRNEEHRLGGSPCTTTPVVLKGDIVQVEYITT